jgi:hypothetical protein
MARLDIARSSGEKARASGLANTIAQIGNPGFQYASPRHIKMLPDSSSARNTLSTHFRSVRITFRHQFYTHSYPILSLVSKTMNGKGSSTARVAGGDSTLLHVGGWINDRRQDVNVSATCRPIDGSSNKSNRHMILSLTSLWKEQRRGYCPAHLNKQASPDGVSQSSRAAQQISTPQILCGPGWTRYTTHRRTGATSRQESLVPAVWRRTTPARRSSSEARPAGVEPNASETKMQRGGKDRRLTKNSARVRERERWSSAPEISHLNHLVAERQP